MFEPGAIIVYTDNLAKSSRFYQELFNRKPKSRQRHFTSLNYPMAWVLV